MNEEYLEGKEENRKEIRRKKHTRTPNHASRAMACTHVEEPRTISICHILNPHVRKQIKANEKENGNTFLFWNHGYS